MVKAGHVLAGLVLVLDISSPWLSSWAPGRGKDVSPPGYGTPFKKGERFVLQVHYNLLAASGAKLETDKSKIVMEVVPAKGATVKQLHVELFPAPVELACPAGVTGLLCDRRQSLIDLAQAQQVHLNLPESISSADKIPLSQPHL
jgi:hypothetical protein